MLFLWAHAALAEISVHTDFEGGNAEVVSLDQAQRTLRIMPQLHPGRGWPCCWSLRVEGLEAGQTFTLEVQAQTRPFRPETAPLAAAWCQPKHAWLSTDEGKTWQPSSPGSLLPDKAMAYAITAQASTLHLAWGPPFVPTDAEALVAAIVAKLPGEAERIELAKTRGQRVVPGLRIGRQDAPQQVWVNARHHAWEAGGSQVGRGFIEWYASDEAKALRAQTCLHFIPIMDVDNAALGAGGKDAIPRDHNRDWAAAPLYPEIAAAQQHISAIEASQGLDVYIDLHNPGAKDPIFFFGPFSFERMAPQQQRNYQRWITLAASTMQKPLPVEPKYRVASYVQTEEERGRMSSGWVRGHTSDKTLSVTLETGWNSPQMTIAGYGEVGAGLGRALAAYLAEQPRRP